MSQPATEPRELVDHRCRAKWCQGKDAYVLESRCANCGWTGESMITVGHESSGMRSTAECPRCECRRLVHGNFVRRVSTDSGQA